MVLLIGLGIALLFIGNLYLSSPKHQARKVASSFYTYEQRGDYASSWSLFHSSMKDKFQQGPYIQDRDHVFMEHFGVETFSFKLSKATKVENWKFTNGAPSLDLVYKMTVTQTFESKYGNFAIYQNVFAVQENGLWKIIWDYNR
jgi:hypothetical protein